MQNLTLALFEKKQRNSSTNSLLAIASLPNSIFLESPMNPGPTEKALANLNGASVKNIQH